MALARPRVGVIGGGLTGLAAAWRLHKLRPHAEIEVWEAASRFGGKLISEVRDGFLFEAAADGFLVRKPPALEWIRELGLEDELVEPRPEHRFSQIGSEGRLHPLPEGFSGLVPVRPEGLLNSSLLTPEGARRAAAEAQIPLKLDGQEESLREFFSRRFGVELFEKLLEPLLSGIYAGDASLLSAEAAFPALVALERSGKSLTEGLPVPVVNSPAFRSFGGGMEAWPQALVGHLRQAGVSLQTNRFVDKISADSAGFEVHDRQGKNQRFDALLLAVGPKIAGSVLKDFGALAAVLCAWPTSSVASVSLAYHDIEGWDIPAGSGFVVPGRENLPHSAVTWSSQKWPHRAGEKGLVVRVYFGGARRPDDWKRPESELLGWAEAALRHWTGKVLRPDAVRVFRWKDGFAQPNLGHNKRLESLREFGVAGIALAGGYFQGAGIPDSLASADRAAAELDRFLAKRDTIV